MYLLTVNGLLGICGKVRYSRDILFLKKLHVDKFMGRKVYNYLFL
jgi:hypothetical protein